MHVENFLSVMKIVKIFVSTSITKSYHQKVFIRFFELGLCLISYILKTDKAFESFVQFQIFLKAEEIILTFFRETGVIWREFRF